jgi:hypothetical protein
LISFGLLTFDWSIDPQVVNSIKDTKTFFWKKQSVTEVRKTRVQQIREIAAVNDICKQTFGDIYDLTNF